MIALRYCSRSARVASRRIISTKPPPFLVEQWSGWESGGGLSNSDCEPMKQKTLLSLADADEQKRWDDLDLGYGHQKGCEHLRAQILSTFEEDVISSRVVGTEDFTNAPDDSRVSTACAPDGLTAGDINVVVPAEGIYLTMNAILEEGDEVVVAMPCYQSLHQLAESKGCKVTGWYPRVSTRPGNDSFSLGPDNTRYYNFEVEEVRKRYLCRDAATYEAASLTCRSLQLERLVTPNTKMVVMNFPHNPTGAMITPGELHRVIKTCKKNDCYLFNDEMYKYLEHKGRGTLPSVATAYEKGISLGGVSKWGSMAGVRIGWIATQDANVMQMVSQLKDYTTISASRPAEVRAYSSRSDEL